MAYDNELRGVLFPNDRKNSDTHPDFTGTVTVQGVEYFADGWKNESKKNGRKFIALKLKRKEKQPTPHDREQHGEREAGDDAW